MLDSDTQALGDLLADDLIFTNHEGRLLTKGDDLSKHTSGALRLSMLSSSSRVIRLFKNTAVVAVAVHVTGSSAAVRFEGDFRFTRVWTARGHRWQVAAVHSSCADS